MRTAFQYAVVLTACVLSQARADDSADATPLDNLPNLIDVQLRPAKKIVPVGGEVMVEFVIVNRTPEPLTLNVPNAVTAKVKLPEMGLPLEHVYSGINFTGLKISTDGNPTLGERVVRKPEYPVPPITLAPFGSVGLRFDVARFYPVLHQSGTYVLQWSPYGGAVQTPPVTIQVVQYKQVVVYTNMGSLTLRLLYDKAPRHVENFLELVGERFYNGLNFHHVFANQFMIGGCPNGDGTGKRPDGLTLKQEFNNTPFELGTVAMALIESPDGRDEHSASCQFFICLARQPSWDGRYTAFAKVEGPESLATLRKMSQAAVDKDNHPVESLKIKSIAAVDLPYPPRLAQ